jgi:hypothetical protein
LHNLDTHMFHPVSSSSKTFWLFPCWVTTAGHFRVSCTGISIYFKFSSRSVYEKILHLDVYIHLWLEWSKVELFKYIFKYIYSVPAHERRTYIFKYLRTHSHPLRWQRNHSCYSLAYSTRYTHRTHSRTSPRDGEAWLAHSETPTHIHHTSSQEHPGESTSSE